MKQTILFILFFSFHFVYAQYLPDPEESEDEWGFINNIPDYELNAHLGAVYAVNPDTVFLTTQEGDFFRSLDGGDSWTLSQPETQDFVDLKFADAQVGFAVSIEGSIIRTENMGGTWEDVSPEKARPFSSIALKSSNDIWVVGASGFILHSTNTGETWSIDSTTTSNQLNSIAFQNDTLGYIAGNDGTLLKTIDGGQVWTPVSLGIDDDLTSISIADDHVFMLQGEVWLDSWDFKIRADYILKSEDGNTWSSQEIYTADEGISSLRFTTDSTGYAVSDAASLCDCCAAMIYKTDDGGFSWTYSFYHHSSANPCISNFGYSDISLADTTGYVFQGNHVLKLHGGDSENPLFLDVKSYDKQSFKVYPNPATNFVTVARESANAEPLNLKLYNLQGKLIYSLSDFRENTVIDMTDFSAGVYFMEFESQGEIFGFRKLIKQ